MAHESFEDDEVAQILNRDFISIKVDREERPDVDTVYMSVCQALTGSGGWPLTIIMTPNQKPFYAATYLPKNSRSGIIGVIELLSLIAQQWKQDRKKFISAGDEITAFLNKKSKILSEASTLDKNLVYKAVSYFKDAFDEKHGGFGVAPKFPTPHNLIFLLSYSHIEKDSNAAPMAEKTLVNMYRGGIFDHIGGGFSRYSTDNKWLVPHFEKMLYDNALLTLAYLRAYQLTGKDIYRRIINKTLNYVLKELTDSRGGFYCGQDADSDGVEGKYYVFVPEEIYKVLGKEKGSYFCNWFGIKQNGNFEGKNIPNLLNNTEFENQNTLIEECTEKLYDYRLKRASLHKDDKILTSWNALMIAAFSKAGKILNETKFIDAAIRADNFISEYLLKDNYLHVRWREGEAAHEGNLDDYAFYALSLMALYDATFNVAYLEKCINMTEKMLDLFFDDANGGFYFYSLKGEQLINRPKELYDGALPSGNSVASLVLVRLAKLTGEIKWQKYIDLQLNFVGSEINKYPAGYSFALLAILEYIYPSKELVCVSADNSNLSELNDLLSKRFIFNLTIVFKTNENEAIINAISPIIKNFPIPKAGSAYYFCQNGTCSKPVYDIKSLCELMN